jgi:two-component system, OmpR family, sensor histidine kinase CiaH
MKQFFSSLSQQWRDWWQEGEDTQPTIFHSARLKLTAFYLAVLLAFCLTLTLSIRYLAETEFTHAGVSERSIVRRLLFNEYSVPPTTPTMFNRYQDNQDSNVHRELNEDVFLINLAALVLGGWLSYWYAGRTLKPIEDAHEAQARFAADASHELRTPLASLQVENEVFLRQKDFSQSEARKLIESNLEEVQRLDNLAANLLALTKYEHASLRLSTVSVAELVTEATKQIGKVAKKRHIAIENHVQAGKIVGHRESLVQLLTIVLDNAFKYGPEKSTVFLSSTEQDNCYQVSIRDQGPGIASSDLPHIFERLYRGDKARSSKTGGYGLGLSLAKEIVEANRASIEATNDPDGGAIFTITFTAA